MRIAIGGFGHETNTFSPFHTEYDDFVFERGPALLAPFLGESGPAGDVELLPTFVAHARPGGLVRKTAYQRIKEELLRGLQATLPVAGVYLDLHGAMEVEEIGDGEGDLVSAVRALVGEQALIAVSLDLHGNVSPTLVQRANILTALRTAPHRDREGTCRRALALLVRALGERWRPVSVLVKPPLLLAGESAMTDVEPARSLYARLPTIGRQPGILDASLLIGCAWTDSAYTSVSIVVVGEGDSEPARQQAIGLAREVWARRHDFRFGMETAPLDDAIRRAMAAPEGPVFLTDSGDNVTAGAAGDIPLCAQRLLALGVQEALVAGLADVEAVRQCAAAGVGAIVSLSLGGKIDPSHQPLRVTGRVLHLGSAPGEQVAGPTMATVQVEGVRILIAVDRRPFTRRADIAAGGADPMQQKIVVVKQGYLFPDLADHAPRAIMALTPGATDLDLCRLAYRRLARPIFPLDGDVDWGG